MSRRIVKPIVNINQSARQMAEGNYDIVFTGKGYKEITQLNDTMNHHDAQAQRGGSDAAGSDCQCFA
ncbi:MAG: HAMP domain-containing protein [Holdemania massiliensis]